MNIYFNFFSTMAVWHMSVKRKAKVWILSIIILFCTVHIIYTWIVGDNIVYQYAVGETVVSFLQNYMAKIFFFWRLVSHWCTSVLIYSSDNPLNRGDISYLLKKKCTAWPTLYIYIYMLWLIQFFSIYIIVIYQFIYLLNFIYLFEKVDETPRFIHARARSKLFEQFMTL